MSDTVWVDIRHIDGDFIVHEDNREDEVFHPLQFHFHSPSEHTIDGRHYDLEMHFYHETDDHLHHSVISIFFDRKVGGNEENPFIKNLFTTPTGEHLSDKESWTPVGVHLEELLLKLDRTKLFHYEGSLTVPPCTENVEWNIIDDPQPISDE
jgi:carbonic anhydrase